jgi:hypothetical protein
VAVLIEDAEVVDNLGTRLTLSGAAVMVSVVNSVAVAVETTVVSVVAVLFAVSLL